MRPAWGRLSSTGHNVAEVEMEDEMHAIGCQELGGRYGPYREEQQANISVYMDSDTVVQDGPRPAQGTISKEIPDTPQN